MSTVPFYQDWTFWQWVVALTALIVSLMPTIRRLLKGPKLDLEAHDRIQIAHTVGNPNISLFLILRNVGGLPIRIKSINLEFKSSSGESFCVPAKTYYPLLSENKQVIFAPFKLIPDEDWSHMVYFFNPFSRNDEQQYRQLVSNLKSDILAKKALPDNKEVIVEADPPNVQPIIEFFNKKFKWDTGEYEVKLIVHTDSERITVSKNLRLTLFESDSKELRDYAEQYKFGLGVVFFDYDKQPGVSIPLVSS